MTEDEMNALVITMHEELMQWAFAKKASLQGPNSADTYSAFLTAIALFAADVIANAQPTTKAMFMMMLAREGGMKVEHVDATQPAFAEPRKAMRSNAVPRQTQRSNVIAHTLTDTEFRYGNRNKDAQTIRDLYRGQGHKRVDVYSPDGDLLQSVEVEP